jgi:diguanylate cyclase (GGDEF)-like protein/PAS domain S-box-containing protein
MTDSTDRAIDPEPARPTRLLAEALNNLSLGLIVFDGKHEIVFCNTRYMEIYGYSSEQVKAGTPIRELIQHRLNLGLKVRPKPAEYIRGRVGNVVPGTTIQEFADGRVVAFTVHPMPDGGGMATHEDITGREEMNARLQRQFELGKEQEERLRIRNLQFDTAINNMSQGLCFFDASHRLIVCNDRYVEMYDLPRDRVGPGIALAEIVDMRFAVDSFPAMSREEYLHWRTNVAVSHEPTDSIVELRNGKTFKIRHRPMPDGGWVATHEDITEQRRSEVKIEYMAHHDALTDLANRVLLNERLEQALGRRIHREEFVAVHHLDLDQFKAVNDTFGHPAGDKLLKIVADRLRGLVRETDTIARMGGDEFVIVQAPISDPADATSLAQRVIEVIGEPFDIDGHQAMIGASIGIAVGPNDGLRPDRLLRNADLALYRAKGDGRGTFRFFEAAMDLQMQTRRIMEQDLRKALQAGEFELYYQPVVNLARNAISGFEALIRWNHPVKGLVSPAAFIPLAEEIGFIVPIGEWVIRQACATAAQWPGDLHVAVNISAAQFRGPGLMQVIVGALAASGLPATRLEIEITETVLLQNRETTLAVLHQLRALGIRIAMDDFGTGYSSLTYLQCFPFDKIKIDRSFVKDIAENSGSLNIVRAVAAMANGMGMTATAEGVETVAQLETITSEGCTEMQGFLFSKPLPASEIERRFLSGHEARQVSDQIVAA